MTIKIIKIDDVHGYRNEKLIDSIIEILERANTVFIVPGRKLVQIIEIDITEPDEDDIVMTKETK